MVYDGNRTPYRPDRALTGFAGHDYDAAISFGMPYEPEDSQYGEYWSNPPCRCRTQIAPLLLPVISKISVYWPPSRRASTSSRINEDGCLGIR